jgi:hypothetical protein
LSHPSQYTTASFLPQISQVSPLASRILFMIVLRSRPHGAGLSSLPVRTDPGRCLP